MHNRVKLLRSLRHLIALALEYYGVPSLAPRPGKSQQHAQRLRGTSVNYILTEIAKNTLSNAHRAADSYIQHDGNQLFERFIARCYLTEKFKTWRRVFFTFFLTRKDPHECFLCNT